MKQPALREIAWPLVGRATELERVTALLRDGGKGAILTGTAGVGKTRLATECLARAAALGFVPLRVAATQAAAGLPFGAFASFVPDLPRGADRLEVLRQIAHAITARGEGKPVAVLVDDAHLLDDFSAALTHLLATQNKTWVVLTLRVGEPAPDAIVALWKDELAERIELQPFGLRQVEQLLAAALAGPVDGRTAHVVWKRTEGNALFIRELALGALEAGVLRFEGGIWRLRGSLPASSRLGEIVEARLGRLANPVRKSLGVLALGEPLEVELLQGVDAEIDLEALQDRGLVHVEQVDRRLTARLHHPLYGEFLRARLSPLRARSSARALADALKRTGARRREDALRLATWTLDGGGSLEPEVMLRATSMARARHDFPLAERLARSALQAGAGFEAGLMLGQVCWLQGRAEEADAHLEALVAEATTDSQRALLASVRIDVLDFGLKRADLALGVAEAAEATITDPAYRDQITAERARILGRWGAYRAAVALATPLLERAEDRALVSACFAAATSMSLTGQTAAAIAATECGLATHLRLSGPPLPFGPPFHLMIRGVALLLAGRLAEARSLADRQYEKSIQEEAVEAQPWFSWVQAWIALNEGRAATASRLAGQSAGAFRELAWPLMVRCALMLQAHALALFAETKKAREVLTELDALGVSPSEFLGPEVLRARAWVDVADNRIAEGRRHLYEAVAMSRSGGALILEAAALHDLARLGGAEEVISRLRELARLVEGPLAPARASHTAALSTGNPRGLEEASAVFEELGALLLAAEASADAAAAWRRQGDPRRTAAAQRRSRILSARCEGARTPMLATSAPARAVLTPRELEVARLAAQGLGDKEIAARLFLSHRTVENKLHGVYEKLGVKGRAELPQALES